MFKKATKIFTLLAQTRGMLNNKMANMQKRLWGTTCLPKVNCSFTVPFTPFSVNPNAGTYIQGKKQIIIKPAAAAIPMC